MFTPYLHLLRVIYRASICIQSCRAHQACADPESLPAVNAMKSSFVHLWWDMTRKETMSRGDSIPAGVSLVCFLPTPKWCCYTYFALLYDGWWCPCIEAFLRLPHSCWWWCATEASPTDDSASVGGEWSAKEILLSQNFQSAWCSKEKNSLSDVPAHKRARVVLPSAFLNLDVACTPTRDNRQYNANSYKLPRSSSLQQGLVGD